MELFLKNRNVFPKEIQQLLRAFCMTGFFDESMLIGSWVMPLYQEAFGIHYVLRTLDIDFAINLAISKGNKSGNLENIITELGYLPVIMQSGMRKYTKENFTIEFIAHRKGSRGDQIITIKKWNVTASPLPFIDLLLNCPFTADFKDFKVRAPLPEAFFIHKLITAQRRPGESKRNKDIEQCSIIATQLDPERLKAAIDFLRPSKKTQRALRESCKAIDFPPHELGL